MPGAVDNQRRGAVYFLRRNGNDWTKVPTVNASYIPATGTKC